MINLHSHLEGRVRPSTAADLSGHGGWEQALELDGPADLTVYLAKVASTYPLFGTPEALFRIAQEAVEDAAADGEHYLELRFGPATHVRDGFGLDDVISAVCAGAAEGSRRSGMPSGVVVAILRNSASELNEDVARAAARSDAVGFDLAGDELLWPELERYVDAFAIARAAGLGLTCHAAEAGPASAALAAQRLFGVTRIGHGAHLVEDTEVLRAVADSGLVVEVCPSSNCFTGAIARVADHPAPAFAAAGVRLVAGDDNPRQTLSLLSNEVRLLRDELGIDTAALESVSLEAAFLTNGQRAALSAR
ncbi:adenosine deaminase [soil metagenome]